MDNDEPAWYTESFSQDYLHIYEHRDTREAARTMDSLLAHVELPSNPVCLDLCCGFGRSFTNEEWRARHPTPSFPDVAPSPGSSAVDLLSVTA